METKQWICQIHKSVQTGETPCPQCMVDYENAPDVSMMTQGERIAEFDKWRAHGQVSIPFELIKKRISELIGRPVPTHEMGSWGMEQLSREIRSGIHPETVEETVPPEMRDKFEIFDVRDPSDEGFSDN